MADSQNDEEATGRKEWGGVGSANSFRGFAVWQEAMGPVVDVYHVLKRFPKQKQFALNEQLTRACVIIPANTAEGNARRSRTDGANFVAIARGSQAEVETLLTIARRPGYLAGPDFVHLEERMIRIWKMLMALRQKPLQSIT